MKKIVQAIPVEILESKDKPGKFYYRLETREGVKNSLKNYSSESQALRAAAIAIEYYWHVGH